MMRSMYSAVSGLKTHQTKMDVIGNNIANVNTVAFKSSSVLFCVMLFYIIFLPLYFPLSEFVNTGGTI